MGSLTQILPLILMFVLFYFLLIRPQQTPKGYAKHAKQFEKGDKVATIGGMHGTIDAIDEKQIVIKSPDGTKLTFDRAAIREITESAPNKEVSV
ncbi:preprotein translocase subunit YajC [[Brevibacterium] frigoritolerans]|uniref:Preprotein translocase subunit YajC n=1 Tax=Peribacillus frigoritolerans TaxID=450367 RepID=A0A941FS30_9BACI|nr:preprotein translocase subunit YajC [Peribacillus frigoritolerans]